MNTLFKNASKQDVYRYHPSDILHADIRSRGIDDDRVRFNHNVGGLAAGGALGAGIGGALGGKGNRLVGAAAGTAAGTMIGGILGGISGKRALLKSREGGPLHSKSERKEIKRDRKHAREMELNEARATKINMTQNSHPNRLGGYTRLY